VRCCVWSEASARTTLCERVSRTHHSAFPPSPSNEWITHAWLSCTWWPKLGRTQDRSRCNIHVVGRCLSVQCSLTSTTVAVCPALGMKWIATHRNSKEADTGRRGIEKKIEKRSKNIDGQGVTFYVVCGPWPTHAPRLSHYRLTIDSAMFVPTLITRLFIAKQLGAEVANKQAFRDVRTFQIFKTFVFFRAFWSVTTGTNHNPVCFRLARNFDTKAVFIR
jgi:hypothetical protein